MAVALATGQRDVATLAHELAHALAGVAGGHDARFRAALVDIVVVLAGPGPAPTSPTRWPASTSPWRRGRGRRRRGPKGKASSCWGGESPAGDARRGGKRSARTAGR